MKKAAAVIVAGLLVPTMAAAQINWTFTPGIPMPVTAKLTGKNGEVIGTITMTPGTGFAYYRDLDGVLIGSSRTDADGHMTFYDPSGQVLRSPLPGR